MPVMDDKKKVVEDVEKDRRFAIDAAVVRIMKSRKVLSHQNVRIHQLYFKSLTQSLSTINAHLHAPKYTPTRPPRHLPTRLSTHLHTHPTPHFRTVGRAPWFCV